jgi:hypothetical protein
MGWEAQDGSGSGSWYELSCVGVVPCILTYDGDPHHMAINYTVLVVLLIAAMCELQDSQRRVCTLRAVWQLCVLVLVVGLQVAICVLVHCTGISIVWNTQASFLLLQRLRARLQLQAKMPKKLEVGGEVHALVRCTEWIIGCRPVDWIVHMGVLVAVAVDLYYLQTADGLTNAAHGCALVLGALVEQLHAWSYARPPELEPEPEPATTPRRHNPNEYVTLIDDSVEP